jgi:hypothetical protein
MPLCYVIDENLRGTLAIALMRIATRHGLEVDAVQIGDELAPPLGTLDSAILVWPEMDERILVSFDRKTLAKHLSAHLAGGHHCPGIFLVLCHP